MVSFFDSNEAMTKATGLKVDLEAMLPDGLLTQTDGRVWARFGLRWRLFDRCPTTLDLILVQTVPPMRHRLAA